MNNDHVCEYHTNCAIMLLHQISAMLCRAITYSTFVYYIDNFKATVCTHTHTHTPGPKYPSLVDRVPRQQMEICSKCPCHICRHILKEQRRDNQPLLAQVTYPQGCQPSWTLLPEKGRAGAHNEKECPTTRSVQLRNAACLATPCAWPYTACGETH